MNNPDIVKSALERDAELTPDEYAKAREKASQSAEFHTGEALPDNESELLKHARIQSNFYGTALNFFLAFQDHLAEIRAAQERTEQKRDLTNALLMAIAEQIGVKIEKGDDGGGEDNAE